MEINDFLDAGFTKSEDPQFKFEYDLSEKTDSEQEHDYKPAILFDIVSNQFCITDGEVMFIYFNAENPLEAIEWANRVTHFEYN